MQKSHKIAVVIVGVIAAFAVALSASSQLYKTSVLGGPGGAIPPGLPASTLSPMLDSLSSAMKSSLGSGLGILQKLEYIPSKNSVLAGEVNKVYDVIAEAEAELAANDTTKATNSMNYLQQLAGGIIISYAKTPEAESLSGKMQVDLTTTAEIISSAEGWVKSYSGADKSKVQGYLSVAKTGLAAANTNFSEDRFPEAAIHFENTLTSLSALLPAAAPDTASEELNFVYEKALVLGLESSGLKAKVVSGSKKAGGTDNVESGVGGKDVGKGGGSDKGGKGSVGSSSGSDKEKAFEAGGGGGASGGSVGGSGSGSKGKDEKASSKDGKKSTSKDKKTATSNKKDKNTKAEKSSKDSSCDKDTKVSSKDGKKSTSEDKKTATSNKKDKNTKVEKSSKDSSCEKDTKASSKDGKKSTSKDKKKSSSKKSTSKKSEGGKKN